MSTLKSMLFKLVVIVSLLLVVALVNAATSQPRAGCVTSIAYSESQSGGSILYQTWNLDSEKKVMVDGVWSMRCRYTLTEVIGDPQPTPQKRQ